MLVKTGYGYFTKDGTIVCKSILPPGQHPIRVGYVYHEVSKAALDKIVVATPPVPEDMQRRKKIESELDKLAIRSLKDKGEWPW